MDTRNTSTNPEDTMTTSTTTNHFEALIENVVGAVHQLSIAAELRTEGTPEATHSANRIADSAIRIRNDSERTIRQRLLARAVEAGADKDAAWDVIAETIFSDEPVEGDIARAVAEATTAARFGDDLSGFHGAFLRVAADVLDDVASAAHQSIEKDFIQKVRLAEARIVDEVARRDHLALADAPSDVAPKS